MPACVTATLHGRPVRFNADPSGASEQWAWFDADGLNVDLTMAWMDRDRLGYWPYLGQDAAEFIAARGGQDVQIEGHAERVRETENDPPGTVY